MEINIKIAVLDYNTSTVDIITVSETVVDKYGGVEEYLTVHCGYNPDEISWMDSVYSVDEYTNEDFSE